MRVSTALGVLMLLGSASGALAQAAAAPSGGSPSSAPTESTALPGDQPPPSVAAMLAPPRPANQPRPAPPAPPAGPGFAVALQAAQAALAHCAADGLKIGVAVSDSQGNLVLGLTADGASPGRIYFAARKNLAAIAFARPSAVAQDQLRKGDKALLARVTPAMVVISGSVPMIVQGKVLGAIGASGATGDQDAACAAAGLAAVQAP